jgi:hypothetical protein
LCLFRLRMLRFASSPATYMSARNSFKVLRRLLVRNEPQHDHAPATTKTKIRAPLIGFSYSQNNVPFVNKNVSVRKLSLRGPPPLSPRVIRSGCSVGCGGARSLRNEPQHGHTSAATQTQMRVPLILLLIINQRPDFSFFMYLSYWPMDDRCKFLRHHLAPLQLS